MIVGPLAPWKRARVYPGPPAGKLALAALAVAKRELGNGEATEDNEGPDIYRYRRGRSGGAWCAAFVAYCLEEGAHELGEPCPVQRSHSAKRLFARLLEAGAVLVEKPAPGDLVLWHRGKLGAWTGHIGIVSTPMRDGGWSSIEGNRGRFPSLVREYQHELGEPLLLGFARLS